MNSPIKTFSSHIAYKQSKFSLLHILTCSVPLTWLPGEFFKLFWHHWLCLAHQVQQLIPDYCLSLPDPRGRSPRMRSGHCWAHRTGFICHSKLTTQRPFTREVLQWHIPGLSGDLCSCRHSQLWQALSHKPACATSTTKGLLARLLQVPDHSTGLTPCSFWNKSTATRFLYNCSIKPEHSWEKLEKTQPKQNVPIKTRIPICQKNRTAESQCNSQRGTLS